MLAASAVALAVMCMPTLAFAAPTITLTNPSAAAERVPFTVLASTDFAAPHGLGATLKHGFEATCGCVVTFIDAGDPIALGAAGDRGADVAVGLPLSALESARARFAPRPHAQPLSLPIAWSDDIFAPLDYGWIGLVHDLTKMPRPPTSWPEIARARPNALRIAIDDPRSGAAGLDAVLWVRATHKAAAADIWADARPKLVIVKTRSEALARLQSGDVDMALAATTWPTTQDAGRYKVAAFSEGQFLQVESAAIYKDAKRPDIAAKFLDYLVSAPAQSAIAAQRGLYPTNPAARTPDAFQRVTLPSWSISLDAKSIHQNMPTWLAEWTAATAR